MTFSKPSSKTKMPSHSSHSLLKPLSVTLSFAMGLALCFAAIATARPAAAQAAPALQARITAPIDNSARATLTGSRPPRALPANDIGAVPSSMQLQGISLVFSRTAAQQAALDTLVAAQQDPASPLYHHWITPDQYAAQFGVAPADIAAVKTWLEQQGFSVDSVSRSHNSIFFSGTAGQVAAAFGVPLHYYLTPGTAAQPAATHFAPSADLTLPAALSSAVLAVSNLSDFRPHAHFKLRAPQAQAQPHFTSSQTGDNFLTPNDVDTIYDVSAATGAGFTGAGQTIAIVGQSAFESADLTNFQTALGIPNKLPALVLVPGTGTSAINPGGSTDTDEVESDIDLEYSNAIAQGATIDFVYTGNSNNSNGAFSAIAYAVDQKIGDIISSSFGACEPGLGSSDYASFNGSLEQAASQGQTVIAAAGDDGSTDCNGEFSASDAKDNEQLAVDFPGSSQYVTSMGGTEFPLADVAPGSPYFDAKSGSDILGSAKSYIPEQVWNDDAGNVTLGATNPSPISSGGGGVSIFTPIPSWQTGFPGIPSNSSNRLVPDIALYASPSEPDVAANTFYGGYLFCTSDTTFTNVTGSCADGFRNASGDLTVAGGTSFDAPIFSGMLAIINQARGYSATNGQGVINLTLYSLAANPSIYATAFHDVTASGNECAAGTTFCGAGPQTTDYLATTGYDEASGLGSIDLFNLLTAWPTGTVAGSSGTFATSTALTAATAIPASGASDTITIAVTSANNAVPTGSLSLSVNGTVVNADLALTNGMATYSFSSTATGPQTISATYSGNSTDASSTGALTLNVGGTPGSFTLAATSVTVAPGASGTGTITITPANGYTGTVNLQPNAASLTDGCIVLSSNSVSITGTAPATATYTVDTSTTACTAAGAARPGSGTAARNATQPHPRQSPWKQLPLPASLAGALLLVFLRRPSRRLRSSLLNASLALALLLALSSSGMALTGCGGSTSTNNTMNTMSNDTPAGAYTITITGTDSKTSTITSSATIALTVS